MSMLDNAITCAAAGEKIMLVGGCSFFFVKSYKDITPEEAEQMGGCACILKYGEEGTHGIVAGGDVAKIAALEVGVYGHMSTRLMASMRSGCDGTHPEYEHESTNLTLQAVKKTDVVAGTGLVEATFEFSVSGNSFFEENELYLLRAPHPSETFTACERVDGNPLRVKVPVTGSYYRLGYDSRTYTGQYARMSSYIYIQ